MSEKKRCCLNCYEYGHNKRSCKKIKVDKIKNLNSYMEIKYLNSYMEMIDIKIRNVLLRPEKNILTYDILDINKTIKNKLITLKEKQFRMKIGEIWQIILGNYYGWENLKIGNEYGLDIISHTKKIAIELKNRTNTDNSSSRQTNFNKLVKFKKDNPSYICIYACINADNEEKTYNTKFEKIIHNGFEIEKHTGYEFIKFILGNDTDKIIKFTKSVIEKYI